MAALNDVYNHYVKTSPCTFDIDPISLEARLSWFEGFGGRNRIVVAVDGDRFLGYACTRPLHERKAYETSVASAVYVHQDHKGRGLGKQLYTALFEAIAGEDLHRCYAGISMPNDASVALHRSFGFSQVAYYTEQGRKFDRYWDVAWFERELG